MNGKKLKIDGDYLETMEEEEVEFYETIDPAQPSTSDSYQREKFHYASAPPPSLSQAHHKNRLRALRETSDAIAEAAKKNGMQTVDRSGSSFVIPITMQAHPIQLNDRVLNEKDDILSQTEALPYCCHCHSIFKTWRGFEYHVLKVHLKYRPFRCYHCQKESFYTEEEGRFHSSTSHPNDDITLVKTFDATKETAAREAFKQIFMMCRDGIKVTKDAVFEWERDAAQQVMKFHYLRFKRPVVLTKKLPTVSREQQSEITGMRLMIQPILSHEQHNDHLFHQSVSLGHLTEYHHMPPPPRLQNRPRSTATQHDEDPRDREKRVAALMHAVTSSRD
uniref:C2H2-type domain-containing protein n=1 Tax=Caenorhabditis tropicalis TaxID=1561998 RepID=A0A1I7TWV7_9PELO